MAVLATVTTQSSRPLANAQHELFAQAVARGATSYTQAAIDAGYGAKSAREQGTRLHRDTRILDRIVAIKAEIVAQLDARMSPSSVQAQVFIRQQVQERGYRLGIAQEMVDRFRCLFDARAAENKGMCPGGESGLHVRTVKAIGSGANFREVVEYTVDRAAVAEFGSWLDRAAIESGDRDEKIIKPPAAMDDETRSMSTDELYARQAILLDAKAKLDALRSGKSLETQRVIESSPLDVVIDTGTVAAVDDGLPDGSIGDSGLAGAEDVGGPL